ncbi:DEAD/DEAH box helicase [Flavihumibacter sp. UBA7668]|uniref:DEAD/DEAH box helicase n=1 Tax=Flavihumibacter sp. UBA7668 TaxID=1946542 RepID=UPI0025BE1184|nr:DEAD/DEAH box helicase [Flavihumibacter sp. UBA7668]
MSKPDRKSAIFLKPNRLRQRWSPVEAFYITKQTRGVDFAREALDVEVARKAFPHWPQAAQLALAALGDEALAQLVQQLTRTHAKQKAGTSLTSYIDRSFLRQVHQLFTTLLEQPVEFSWYHQTVNPVTGNHLTTTCLVNRLQPKLSFKVEKKEAGLQLVTLIRLENEQTGLDCFQRDYFFLSQQNNYWLLSLSDYQTLQWLAANDPAVYADDPAGFSEHVLKRLESDYEIEMGSLLNKEMVEVRPTHAVYLSEISGSFLMLTPRWNYDGFWVEGSWKHTEEFTRNGEVFVVKRDRGEEQLFHDRLQSLHPNFSRQLNGVFNLPFAEAKRKHWFLKVYHRLLEENVELLGMEMLRTFRYSQFPPETDCTILKTEGSSLHISFALRFGAETIPLPELQKLLLAGVKSVLLKDHSIGVLTEEWLNRFSAIVKHGKIKGAELIVPQWILLGLQKEESVDTLDEVSGELEEVPVVGGSYQLRRAIAQAWWEKWLHWQSAETTLVPLPSAVKAVLRPYQQKGFEWICLLSEIDAGACLADDMGLGKTLQTICFLAHRMEVAGSDFRVSMIVCPATLMHNWRLELEKFAPSLGSFIYHGSTRDMEAFRLSGARVLITSYGTLRSDIERLQVVNWDVVVLDESHTIKNPSAQITKAVYQLKAAARVALSGTPVMNNTFDLYAQLHFLVPGLFGQPEFFRKEYAHPIDRERNEEKMQALKQLTAPFVLRRTKLQVATDLPPKTESVLWCEMSEDQKAMYDEIKSQIRDSIFLNIQQEGMNKSKLSILAGMQKLRQVCAAPALVKDAGLVTADSVKIEVLMEELQNNLRNNKVLIFSQFKGMLNLIGQACQQAGMLYYHFDGDTPPAKRSELVEQFQTPGNEVNIFLISLKAGNTGLTLTAADYVFLVDPWWNTAVQQQAVDRAYRIGQTKNVFAYQMICKDSIEEKIIELQDRKRLLSDALITEDEGFIKQLTEDDLRYLFS